MQVDQRTRITETGHLIPSRIGTIQHGVVSTTRLAESEGGKTHIWLLPVDNGLWVGGGHTRKARR